MQAVQDQAKQSATSVAMSSLAAIFEYDTAKIVHIRSMKVGITNRLLQLAVFTYLIVWVLVLNHGYQEIDPVVSAVTSKVKGIAEVRDPVAAGVGNHTIWDVADYVVPSLQNGAFFVTTNMLVTKGQQVGICPESPMVKDALCQTPADCLEGRIDAVGNGIQTGDCVPSASQPNITVCQIKGWCPVEVDEISPLSQLPGAINFTVLIKNSIEFPKWKVQKRNILETHNKTWLSGCRYDAEDEQLRFCPVFVLGKMVEYAKTDWTEIAQKGGVISVKIYWDCNLDRSFDKCVPAYSFRRIDNAKSPIAPGFNFRYANYYKENGVDSRDLIKAVGIQFDVMVEGQARKFDIIPLATNIGSGIGLLAIASVLCDIFVLHCLKKKDYYYAKKYLVVTGDDAFKKERFQESQDLTDVERSAVGSSEGPVVVSDRRPIVNSSDSE